MKKKLLFLVVMFLMFVVTGCAGSDEKKLQNYLDGIAVETEVSENFYLPRNVDGKTDHEISWTSANTKLIKIGNLADIDGKSVFVANVTQDSKDQTVELTATVELASGVKGEKKFTVTVKGNPDVLDAWPYEENKAYKLTLVHTNPTVNKTFYFTGEMKGFYLDTTEVAGAAVDVFCEKAGEGYKLYFKKDNAKIYLGIQNSADGKHTNAVFGADKDSVYKWNKDLQTVETVVDGKKAFLGTDAHKTFTTIGGTKNDEKGAYCYVTLTVYDGEPVKPEPKPDPQPQPEVKGNVLTSATLGVGDTYGDGTAEINGVKYAYVALGDFGSGIQMKNKEGVTSSIKNTTAFAKPVNGVKLTLTANKTGFSNEGVMKIELGDEAGVVLETLNFDTVKGQAEYAIKFSKAYKYVTLTHTMSFTAYYASIEFVENMEGEAVKPEPQPDPQPQPEVKGNVLTSASLGLTETYEDGTAEINGVSYSYVALGDFGSGIQMKNKNGITSSIKNTTAFANGVNAIKIVLTEGKTGFANEGALKIDLADEDGTIIKTVYLDTAVGQAEYTINFDKAYKFVTLTQNITFASYFASFEFVEATK